MLKKTLGPEWLEFCIIAEQSETNQVHPIYLSAHVNVSTSAVGYICLVTVSRSFMFGRSQGIEP